MCVFVKKEWYRLRLGRISAIIFEIYPQSKRTANKLFSTIHIFFLKKTWTLYREKIIIKKRRKRKRRTLNVLSLSYLVPPPSGINMQSLKPPSSNYAYELESRIKFVHLNYASQSHPPPPSSLLLSTHPSPSTHLYLSTLSFQPNLSSQEIVDNNTTTNNNGSPVQTSN